MTERVFDDAEANLACPNCGQRTEQTVGWLHTHDEAICPRCGNLFRVDSTQAIRALQACAHTTDDVGRNPYEPIKVR